MKQIFVFTLTAICAFLLCAHSARAQRLSISLNGSWQIEEGVAPDDVPRTFTHTVQVPGLANLSLPAFPDVDRFESRELIANFVRRKERPASALTETVGVPLQKRNFFWYATTFRAPQRKEVVLLKINKAQFGTVVYLNGKKIGEHFGCFTAGYFNLTDAINFQGENKLVVRIGAHPAALPASVPTGTDQEKIKWTPGIYDDVSLLMSDNPVIETIQIAPRIKSSEIIVQTKVKNFGAAARDVKITQQIKTWKTNTRAGQSLTQRFRLGAGEEKILTQALSIPNATLWSPENPFLYQLETSTNGDSAQTRFGMREFRFDTATKRAYLNDKVYFLRGSNIALHRFFEDPLCKALPWNEQWVRKLLVDVPKKLHWNSFRLSIGPVPDKWLDIADEAGLLLQSEFPIWRYHDEWDTKEVTKQFAEFMRDQWNHPSVAVWDACNETAADIIGERIIPAVRGLDLSNRAWDNGYNNPVGADDPVENHPYLFIRFFSGRARGEKFDVSELEEMSGEKKAASRPHPTGHAIMNNEYGWLWLTRDGQPTRLTQEVYKSVTKENATAEERFAINGYLLGGLTEYWRAHRNFAGVQYFVYLTASYPGVFTGDNFQDIENLKLEPHFEDYMSEANNPLGLYINFWHPTLRANVERAFPISMINDEYETARGKLVLSLQSANGTELTRTERPFEVAALGQQTYNVKLKMPLTVNASCILKATAYPDGKQAMNPTISRRRVAIAANAPE